ncbi:hypothetical protein DWV72_01090 [Firmicutes bacterium AF12-30]|nr:hypothetical protein DWV72_01090 [Firmicutes bacterium AF12-30]
MIVFRICDKNKISNRKRCIGIYSKYEQNSTASLSVAYLFFIIYSNSTVGQLQIKILVHYILWISFHPVFYIVKINDRTFY